MARATKMPTEQRMLEMLADRPTLRQMAVKCGVSRQSISNWLTFYGLSLHKDEAPPKRPVTALEVEILIEQGMSYRTIAAMLGCSRGALTRALAAQARAAAPVVRSRPSRKAIAAANPFAGASWN